MSVMGQKRKSEATPGMSAPGGIADVNCAEADIGVCLAILDVACQNFFACYLFAVTDDVNNAVPANGRCRKTSTRSTRPSNGA